ncbi:MAG: hypothetical protein NUV91_00545 [Candidatus Omnitrophica bacterium]|nr:hypothetical protein [Candidatus Omnitrophota bacterium]
MKRLAFIVLLILGSSFVYAQQEPFVYDDHGKRDPFWRLVLPNGSVVNYDRDLLATDLVVEGIVSDAAGKNVAIINGQILKIGDPIGAYTIKSIESDGITIEKGQEIMTLKIKKED